jgi:hypothetical protein
VQKIVLLFVVTFFASNLLSAQFVRNRGFKDEHVKLEICDVMNLRVVDKKQTNNEDTVIREVSDVQLEQIKEQLDRLKVCYWMQTYNSWGESCPNESKRLDRVYVFLVRGENSEIKDGNIIPVFFTKERVVTGHMNDLLGPPSMR